MRSQNGSALFIAIILGTLIIAGLGLFMFTGKFSSKPDEQTTYKADINAAKDLQIKSDFIKLRQSLELYRSQKESYPDNLSMLKDEKLLNAIPQNPYSNDSYEYISDGTSYTLTTKLGDGSEFKLEP